MQQLNTEPEFEIEKADPEFQRLLDNYNDANEAAFYYGDQDHEQAWMKQATEAMYEYGAWVDSDGYWRHPSRLRGNSE